VVGLEVVGLEVVGLEVVGLEVVGLEVVGLEVVGLSSSPCSRSWRSLNPRAPCARGLRLARSPALPATRARARRD
jgi:hypothetical protein